MEASDFRTLLRKTILLPTALLCLLAAILTWQVSYLVSAIRLVDHTDRVVSDGRLLMRLMVDMESGLRGYLLTGDRSFLEPYSRAEPMIQPGFQELHGLLAADPAQSRKLDNMRQEFEAWHVYAQAMISRREAGQAGADLALNRTGKQMMDAIRSNRESLLDQIERVRNERARRAERASRLVLPTTAVLTLLVAALIAVLTRRRMYALSDSYENHLKLERRRAEEARENRAWLLTTLQSLGEGVIATDSQGQVKFMNSAAESLTGWREPEAAAARLSDVLPLHDTSGRPVPDPVNRVRAADGAVGNTASVQLARKDGSKIWVDESAAPLLDEEGTVQGVVVVFRDVSERLRAENLLRSSERLAMVGRLAATIAHEIQNPLDSLGNLLYLIRKNPDLPGSVLNNVIAAEEEVTRTMQITRHLLSFNREARQPIAVDLCDVIYSVLALFAAKLQAQNIKIKSLEVEPATVMGFPGELRQVFSNLIANAIDALGSDGTISVSVNHAPDWRDHRRRGVRVIVADNGPGIPRSARSGLFTPFHTTKGEKGTGLGLWVSRGIVEKHEGDLRYRTSVTGKHHGTLFRIFIPDTPSTAYQRADAA